MLCVLTFWRLLKIFEKMEEEVILRIAHERHVHSTIPFQMFWRLWIGFEPCRWNDINIKLNRLRLAYALAFPSWIHDVHHNALYSSVKVNQKSDCRLVKNHQFACIHVGNKGQVFESKLDGIFLSSLFYSFSVTGPHIFCWWFLFENIDLPRA